MNCLLLFIYLLCCRCLFVSLCYMYVQMSLIKLLCRPPLDCTTPHHPQAKTQSSANCIFISLLHNSYIGLYLLLYIIFVIVYSISILPESESALLAKHMSKYARSLTPVFCALTVNLIIRMFTLYIVIY